MKLSNLFTLLIAVLLLSACGKSEDDEPTDDEDPIVEECPLSGVLNRTDPNTAFGLLNASYDDNDQITAIGIQSYDITHDADGNVIEGLLVGSSFNPQVRFVFTYTPGGEIETVKSIWGEAPNEEERYVYTPTYSNGYVDMVSRTGLFEAELDYDFDNNGNVLKWTDPIFDDYIEFTYDTTNKGLVEGLTHNQAFAYGLIINQPFFHMNNAVTTEMTFGSDGTLDMSSTFENIFNDAGFQTEASDPNGRQYIFEYECN